MLFSDFCEFISDLSKALDVVYNFANFFLLKFASQCVSGHVFYSIMAIWFI